MVADRYEVAVTARLRERAVKASVLDEGPDVARHERGLLPFDGVVEPVCKLRALSDDARLTPLDSKPGGHRPCSRLPRRSGPGRALLASDRGLATRRLERGKSGADWGLVCGRVEHSRRRLLQAHLQRRFRPGAAPVRSLSPGGRRPELEGPPPRCRGPPLPESRQRSLLEADVEHELHP